MKGSSVRAETNRDRGAAVVEMALVTVFLVILVMGVIDVGRAIFTNIAIQEAAQEGAYYSAFDPDATEADIVQRAVASTSDPAIDPTRVDVECSPATKSKKNGTRVVVTVEHDLDLITPLVGQWMGGSRTLAKTAEAERFFELCPA